MTYTLQSAVTRTGIGLHGGTLAEVTLRPRPQGGVKLRVNGKPLPLTPLHMRPTPLCTFLEADVNGETVTLSTPEHLFAALHGLAVTGLEIEVTSDSAQPEVPLLDGSALPWVQAIDEAGRVPLENPPEVLKVRAPCHYRAEGRVLLAAPRLLKGLRISCHIEFPHPVIGRQQWSGVITEDVFRTEIAPARSFAMESDVRAAMAAGMLKGASLEGGVLFDEAGHVANTEGLRFPDEPVRHKVTDFLGDSFLSGRVLQGDITLTAPGHTANNMLLRQIYQQDTTESEAS